MQMITTCIALYYEQVHDEFDCHVYNRRRWVTFYTNYCQTNSYRAKCIEEYSTVPTYIGYGLSEKTWQVYCHLLNYSLVVFQFDTMIW